MKYKIVEQEAFKVVGVKISTTNDNQEGYKKIPKFWMKMIINKKKRERLLNLMNTSPFGMLGVNIYNVDRLDSRKFDYLIGCATTMDSPEDLQEYLVPPRTWAVFPCSRKEVGKTEIDIVMKWQPTSDYELLNTGYESGYMQSNAPDIEVHGKDDDAEVWVAVRKKDK